jgi:hypothetical protein
MYSKQLLVVYIFAIIWTFSPNSCYPPWWCCRFIVKIVKMFMFEHSQFDYRVKNGGILSSLGFTCRPRVSMLGVARFFVFYILGTFRWFWYLTILFICLFFWNLSNYFIYLLVMYVSHGFMFLSWCLVFHIYLLTFFGNGLSSRQPL